MSDRFIQAAVMYDLSFDKIVMYIMLSVTALSLFVALYQGKWYGFGLLTILTAVIFVSVILLRSKRNQYFQAVNEDSTEVEKLGITAQHNIDLIKSKIIWISIILACALYIASVLAMGITDHLSNPFSHLISIVISGALSWLLFRHERDKMRQIAIDYKNELEKINFNLQAES
jgi:hypothetical protein